MKIIAGEKYENKSGDVVEVTHFGQTFFNRHTAYENKVVLFLGSNKTESQILTETDFLEQYKPYNPVYEYKWVVGEVHGERITKYYTDAEAEKALSCYLSNKQRLDYTKTPRCI